MAESQSGNPQEPRSFGWSLRLLLPEFTYGPLPTPRLFRVIENRLKYQQPAQAELEDRLRAVIDEALANVPARSKDELERLSKQTREDLRFQLLQGLEESDRDNWAAVLAMQSAETTAFRLLVATWGLVAATVALVIATAALVMVALLPHRG